MPTQAITSMTAKHACNAAEFAVAIGADSDADSDDEELAEMMFLEACEPFTQRLLQDIGAEKLSIARLQREQAARGRGDGDESWNVYGRFGFYMKDLPAVVDALDAPAGFRTAGGHVFDGEEGVLLLLRRFRSTDPLLTLTEETGRSISAISEAVCYMVEHIHAKFPHLIDERSFSAWAPKFAAFAEVFSRRGIPIDNLIAFIDGKLFPVCRPGKWQQVLYSGHKRIHGIKVQGLVFPNGAHSLAELAHLHSSPHTQTSKTNKQTKMSKTNHQKRENKTIKREKNQKSQRNTTTKK